MIRLCSVVQPLTRACTARASRARRSTADLQEELAGRPESFLPAGSAGRPESFLSAGSSSSPSPGREAAREGYVSPGELAPVPEGEPPRPASSDSLATRTASSGSFADAEGQNDNE